MGGGGGWRGAASNVGAPAKVCIAVPLLCFIPLMRAHLEGSTVGISNRAVADTQKLGRQQQQQQQPFDPEPEAWKPAPIDKSWNAPSVPSWQTNHLDALSYKQNAPSPQRRYDLPDIARHVIFHL